jgi:hypothetical protein
MPLESVASAGGGKQVTGGSAQGMNFFSFLDSRGGN